MTTLFSISRWALLGLVFTLAALTGCANLPQNLEQPKVHLSSVALGTPKGFSQTLDIELLITNPNSVALPVTGMNYHLTLNGEKLMTGVSNQIPVLEAYSETPVQVTATLDLFSVGKFIKALMQTQSAIDYELGGKLDLTSFRLPLNFSEAGKIDLGQ